MACSLGKATLTHSNQDVMGNADPLEALPRRRTGCGGRRNLGTALLLLFAAAPSVIAECVSLKGSSTCPAFEAASVSTQGSIIGLYPFLQYVSDRASFDERLAEYVHTDFVQKQFQYRLGCRNINLKNTTNLYARFALSVVCNGIVQNSINECKLTGNAARPVCADSCAQYAESEAYYVADNELCKTTKSTADVQSLIRADFTDCALPADSLSTANCVQAIANEPDNCGYLNSTVGLCSYCASGGINSTDTCCYNSKVDTRCAGVVLPSIVPTLSLSPPTATATSTTSTQAAGAAKSGISGGAIAGIAIGSVAGLILLGIIALLCIRRGGNRKGSQKGSVFNQPTPSRQGPGSQSAMTSAQQDFEVSPGGRIARMSALESNSQGQPSGLDASGLGSGGGQAALRRGRSTSTDLGESAATETLQGVLRSPPLTTRRQGSLSSNSMLLGDERSPSSADMSSPQGVASQQSEQLPFFKDYYSQDDIHPGDRVAVLWAYQPRAADEFALERGDMVKVVGIWDDGWATGILMDERADEWEARRQALRDSGVSHTSGRARDASPPVSGEIKAFPLVCVCLPEHWRKTIEGDGSAETASSARHG